MGKIVLAMLVSVQMFAGIQALETHCLACHQKQNIPSNLIYKRYLMKYSTDKAVENAMFKYLKDPTKRLSIMPPQFFLKFPMRDASVLDDGTLRENIKAYLKHFDIKKKLIVEQ